MFVAFTGYGRIATLGEEVKDPPIVIPRAIILTLAISMALYLLVGSVGLAAVGAEQYGQLSLSRIAPLQLIAEQFDQHWVRTVVSVGALTAMIGVLLNLILGLSRVVLAMGRRKDMPTATAKISESNSIPRTATLTVAAIISSFALIGNIKIAWSFSAFTVLVYYAITNACALRLKPEQRMFPRWISWCGLVACLFLAFWVEPTIWAIGIALIAIGLGWKKFWNLSS